MKEKPKPNLLGIEFPCKLKDISFKQQHHLDFKDDIATYSMEIVTDKGNIKLCSCSCGMIIIEKEK